MNINKLIQIAHKIINLKNKSTKEKVPTHVKSSQQNRVRPLCWFLSSLPELFLRSVSVHWTDPEQAVAELLGDIGEISGLRADDHSVINQTEMLTQRYNPVVQRILHFYYSNLIANHSRGFFSPDTSFPSLCFPIISVNFSSVKQFKLLWGQRSNRATFWLSCTKLVRFILEKL